MSGASPVDVEDCGLAVLTGTPSSGNPPVATFTAKWKDAWTTVEFRVNGQLYCTAKMDVDNPALRYPAPPILTDSTRVFAGWSRLEGDYLMMPSSGTSIVVDALVAS